MSKFRREIASINVSMKVVMTIQVCFVLTVIINLHYVMYMCIRIISLKRAFLKCYVIYLTQEALLNYK